MHKVRSILAALVLVAPGCASGSLVVHKPADQATNQAVTALWARDVRRTAQTGDWILSRSYSKTADFIAGVTTRPAAPSRSLAHRTSSEQ